MYGGQAVFKNIWASIVAIIGFVLSPLSWWNDLIVNVPLAGLFALGLLWIIQPGESIRKPLFVMFFFIGYTVTNVAGIIMMEKGVRTVLNKNKRNLTWSLIVGVIYSLAATWIASSEIVHAASIVPDWLQP